MMARDLHILLVENDRYDADIVLHELEFFGFKPESPKIVSVKEFEISTLDDRWDIVFFLNIVTEFDFPAAILDMHQRGISIPIIFVTETISDDEKIKLLEAGINECLLLSDIKKLGAVVQREISFQKARKIGQKIRWGGDLSKRSKDQLVADQQAFQKEALLREVFDSAVEGFLILTVEGKILEANDAYCEMSGYLLEELQRLSASDLDVEDDAALVALRIQRAMTNGAERFETRHQRKDGSVFNVEVSATYLSEGDGRFICFCRDITERKEMENELQQRLSRLIQPVSSNREIQFEDLFDIDVIQQMQDKFADATGVASLITRPDGTPITRQSNFCRLCNIIRSTEKGRTNCYHSDAEIGKLNLHGATIQACMSGGLWDAGAGISVGGQHIANWLIGQVRDETQKEDQIRKYAHEIGVDEVDVVEAFNEVKSMSKEQFEKVSQALYIIANQLSTIAYQNVQQARFIDEQKKVAQALIESEARYKVFFDSGPDAVLLVDAENGDIVEFNERAHIQLGYSREEFSQLRIEDIDATESAEDVNSHMEKILEAGHDEFETLHQTKRGDIRNVNVIVQIVYAGDKPYYLSIYRDITERKQAERKISEYQEHLEDLVERRTSELKAINNELEAFSYSVSHDLRAPLRAINGFCSVLSDDYAENLDETGQHYLSRIQTATNRMGQLIEDLLNLSHITQREIQFMEVNLSHLAEKIVQDILDQAPGRILDVKIAPDIVVWADYNLMKIALENLLANAFKFTINLKDAVIVFGVKDQDGKTVYYVQDNGAGFNMEYADKLFTPFQRLHSKEEYKGTGIGLSIVKRIISRHNGMIWAESSVGKGATFFFTLPKRR